MFHHRKNRTGFEPQETSLNETFFFSSLIVFCASGFYFGFKVKRELSALPAEVGGRQGVRGRAVNWSLSKDFT